MAQADYFLDLDKVDGESQDDTGNKPNLNGKIHISSFSFGVSNAGTGGINLGSGASKSQVQDLHLTKMMDVSSPNLWIGCCSGKHFDKATFYARRAGDDPQVYLKYEMTEVFITSYSTSGAEGGGMAQESFSLNFSKIVMTYTTQAPKGGDSKSIPKTWDIKGNKAT